MFTTHVFTPESYQPFPIAVKTNSDRGTTSRSRYMARANGALNSQPHTHTRLRQTKDPFFLFTVQGSKISFHLHPFGEYWAATVSSTFSGDEAGIKRVPRLPRLAFEIISRTRCWTGFWDLSILDILRYSVLSLVFIWFWLARCILHYRTAVVVGRPTSSSLTSWHLSGSVHLLFILFCSSHSAVFGFSWKPAASNL